MSVQGMSHHYISNAELLAWMSARTGALNDEMAEAMDIADQRSEIVKRLTDIKANLSGIDNDGGKGCMVADEMRQLLADYANHPDAEELAQTLNPIIERLDQAEQAWSAENRSGNASNDPNAEEHTDNQTPFGNVPEPSDYQALKPKAQDVTDWQTQVQGNIDKFGRDDQQAVIRIQDLSSRANQVMQLASNLIAGANEAAKTAISNIRG